MKHFEVMGHNNEPLVPPQDEQNLGTEHNQIQNRTVYQLLSQSDSIVVYCGAWLRKELLTE